jgi:hypothetical protein
MVRSKRKKVDDDPYEALQHLMDDPGSPFEIWDDTLMVTTDDPLAQIKILWLAFPDTTTGPQHLSTAPCWNTLLK